MEVVAIGALVLYGSLFVATAREDAARRAQRCLERLSGSRTRLEQAEDELTEQKARGRAQAFKNRPSGRAQEQESSQAQRWTPTGRSWRKTRSLSTRRRRA